ncbi:MAG: hypothetical protein JO192_09510 [Candidatus Eremiobacteraeota bacterium]|nr:hypothetical protein [Candidatus Eremiobacteraeota bacterium]MBV8722032.1 hypothetical protein [Candidatus Eremiobacteraeota bacterium]
MSLSGFVPRPAVPIATIAVDLSSQQRTIPNDFDGFSIEVNDAAEKYLGTPQAPNLVFEQLLRNLGPSTIRIGGDSSDFSCWNPRKAPYPAGCLFAITPDTVRGFVQASARTGWGITAGINLAQNDATWTLPYGIALSRAAASTPGSRLVGFEFGNEPDLYPSETLYGHHRIRPSGYSWPNVVADWKPYVVAFKGDPATARFALIGPAYDDSSDVWRNAYLAPFARGVGARNLGFLTVHDYPTYTCGGHRVTVAQLLSPQLVALYRQQARGWIATAGRLGLPLVLGETNSTACGGQNGVDNVFAATAWGLDWLFINAQLGFARIHFHMDDAYYSAVFVRVSNHAGSVTYRNVVAPLYYAMYAFGTLAQGHALLTTTVTTQSNIAAYAVAGDRNTPARLFVINKDLRAAGTVVVRPSSRTRSARLLVVAAPALTSGAVAFGGASFDDATGRLRSVPRTTALAADAAGNYAFTLPNASIAILSLTP